MSVSYKIKKLREDKKEAGQKVSKIEESTIKF